MNVKAQVSGGKITVWIILGVVCLLILSLISNIFLVTVNRNLIASHEKIIIPMTFNSPFSIAENQASAQYLQMMALSFISLRLNVTPETVNSQHNLLLSYVRPEVRENFSPILEEESRRIRDNAVSSAFYESGVQIWPSSGIIDIRGVLRTWIGHSQPREELRHYRLQLKYAAGVTHVEKFIEVSDAKKK